MNEPGVPPVHRRIPSWVLDLIAGVLVVVVALLPSVGRGGDRGPEVVVAFSPWTIVIAVAAAVVLPLRRRWPIPVLVATIALLFAGTLAVGSTFPFVLPVAIAAFGVTTRLERRRSIPVVASAIVLLVAAELLLGLAAGFDPRYLPAPAIVAFAAAVGDATRSRRAYIDAITERAERAERTKESEALRRVAEERLRIARDLHDAVAHQIAVINLHSGVANRAIAADRAPDLTTARTSLATISDAARTVLSEIGDLLSVLRSDPAVGEAPAPTAPQAGLADLEDLLTGFATSGLDTTIRVDGPPRSIPPAADRVAYQVIREGLTNAHKHGASGRAHLLLVYGEGELGITITNPVDVTDEAQGSATSSGHGLTGIRERVASVRGTTRADVTGSVYRLVVTLPVVAGERAELGAPPPGYADGRASGGDA